MKKNVNIMVALTLLLSPAVKAQVAPSVLQKYNARIVAMVSEIINRGKLPEDKQEELAKYLTQQDAKAEQARLKGASANEIASYYSRNNNILTVQILTPLEYIDFSNANGFRNNITNYVKAIRYRKDMGLNEAQVNKLLYADKTADKQNPAAKNIEFTELAKILNNEQFNQFIILINNDKAVKATKDYWEQLKKYELVNNADSSRINKQIFDFVLNQAITLDKIGYTYPRQTDSVKRRYLYFRPNLLIKLDGYKKALPSIIPVADVVNNYDKLKLTSIQMDSLLYGCFAIERKRYNNNIRYSNDYANSRKDHLNLIARVLTNNQRTKYLEIKNYKRSLFNTDNDWATLTSAGLIKPEADKALITQELQKYELAWLVANEKLSDNKTQEAIFEKQRVENNKPELLKKLETINNTNANNRQLKESFAW